MKRTLLFLALFLSSFYFYGQCPAGDISLLSQTDVDNFVTNYPNCTLLDGNLLIDGGSTPDTVTDLVGLNGLTQIEGSLEIKNNFALTNLNGLGNISSINGAVLIEENNVLVNIEGLQGLSHLGSSLTISKNRDLETLSGLGNITEITTDLKVLNNPSLLNVSGLDGLLRIGNDSPLSTGNLTIEYNENLSTLTGFGNLTRIDQQIRITNNGNLIDFEGLNSLTFVGGNIYLYANQALVNLQGLESLETVNGDFEIKFNTQIKNLSGCPSLNYIGGSLIINEIWSLEDFSGMENLQEIGGSLKILDNDTIRDLEGFISLDTVGSSIEISGNENVRNLKGLEQFTFIPNDLKIGYNNRLESLEGLDNLEYVSGLLEVRYNQRMTSLAGPISLQKVGAELRIWQNNAIVDLTGLETIREIENTVDIADNERLKSLRGLNGLTTMYKHGDNLNVSDLPSLGIGRNDSLTTFEGLENLRNFNGRIFIKDNKQLVDISALGNMNGNEINAITIRRNESLAICNQVSICQFLPNNEGNTSIFDNALGCNSYEEIISRCDSNSVTGSIFYNTSDDQCTSSNLKVPNSGIIVENGSRSHTYFADSNGNFKIFVPNGSHTVSPQIDGTKFSLSPEEAVVDFPQSQSTEQIDFCLTPFSNFADLTIDLIPLTECRPGFTCEYLLVFKNVGTEGSSGEVQMDFNSEKLEYNLSNPSEILISPGSITWNFSDLLPFQTRFINVSFSAFAPPVTDINDSLEFSLTINPVQQDDTPDNNSFHYKQNVVGSYDPNDITVLEGKEVYIDDAGEYLNYVIRFQNTGTASAINVKIDHELDANLDWETYEPISSSHSNSTKITDGMDVEFLFENIHLPDSTTNEPDSHGYVAFKIKPKAGISIGDMVQGTASIYFDFNPPIITDTITTEFIDNPEPLNSFAMEVSPILCHGADDAEIQVEATGGKQPYLFELLDENLNQLISLQAVNFFDNIGPGDYFTKVVDDNGVESIFNIVIQEPLPIDLTTIVTNITCNGTDDGRIEVAVTGGTMPYRYRLDGGTYRTSNLFDNLAPGQYIIEATDINDCTVSQLVAVLEPPELKIITTKTDVQCNGGSEGQIEVSAIGGIEPYKYRVNGETFQNDSVFANLPGGQYTLQATDANGCTISELVEILEPEPLTVTASVMEISCKGLNDGSITITASGGELPYEYSLDGISFLSNDEFVGLVPATYSIWVRDFNGCTALDQVVLSESDDPDFDDDGLGDMCDGDIDGDGVVNEIDDCPRTILGSSVDPTGCIGFTLPSSNFTVQTTGESCASSNNGRIIIKAAENYMYRATLNGAGTITKDFTDTASFEGLAAGSYQVCLTVMAHPEYEKCFTVRITEPEVFSVDSKINSSGKSVVLKLKGGINYDIMLNGVVYNTSESEIILPLSQAENSISVKTDKDCQGVYENNLLLNYGASVYPNPVKKGAVTISIVDNFKGTVLLSLFDNTMRLVNETSQELTNGSATLNMDGLAAGLYSLRVRTERETYVLKIIKE